MMVVNLPMVLKSASFIPVTFVPSSCVGFLGELDIVVQALRVEFKVHDLELRDTVLVRMESHVELDKVANLTRTIPVNGYRGHQLAVVPRVAKEALASFVRAAVVWMTFSSQDPVKQRMIQELVDLGYTGMIFVFDDHSLNSEDSVFTLGAFTQS